MILLTAVRKFIGAMINDGTKIRGYVCPNCEGSEGLVIQSGCYNCTDCGYSGCG